MSDNEIQVELERLRAENARLKGGQSRVSLKVGAKGGVSLYGLGRFPVTLYKEQWTKLLDMADDTRAFIRANDSCPKTKS
jgi:50S ribosomal subunit-associated GTPase HflX